MERLLKAAVPGPACSIHFIPQQILQRCSSQKICFGSELVSLEVSLGLVSQLVAAAG